MRNIGTLFGLGLCALLWTTGALAAPDRLNDDVPDATPDEKGAISFSYGHEAIDVEGSLNDERTAHDYYKFRYTFSPKNSVTFKVTSHDLVGGFGLFNPLLDNQDQADSYTIDLNINMMNIPRTDADEANGVPFAAGSAFGVGVSGTQFQLDSANLSRDETMLKAYLTYTTDLSEDMKAHTYFSTGRLSGDTHTGSVNRVAAGIDYDIIPGKRPLVLMANGILDIYNFREPVFNTSRVSRFDVGLRYRVAKDWFASAGWVTINDSENNASGSGVFAGINYVNMPSDPTEECEIPAEEVPEPVEEASAWPDNMPAYDQTPLKQPPLMAIDLNTESSTANGQNSANSRTASSADSESNQSTSVDNGITVPPLPDPIPNHTSADAVFVRAGYPANNDSTSGDGDNSLEATAIQETSIMHIALGEFQLRDLSRESRCHSLQFATWCF